MGVRLIVVLFAAAVIVAGGCGGSGKPSEGGSAKHDIQPEAQKRAEAIGLQLSDFPEGWRGSADEKDEDFRLRRCLGGDFSDLTLHADADSQDFAMGDNTEAGSSVSVFADEKEATTALTRFDQGLRRPSAEDCLGDLIKKAMKKDKTNKGVTVGDIDVGELKTSPAPGVPETKAWEIAIPVQAQGISVSAYIDIVALHRSDTLAFVLLEDVFDPFDSDLRDQLVDAVAGRLTSS